MCYIEGEEMNRKAVSGLMLVLLLVSIFCGLFVSLFQAVTSLKDMTMTLVPKLLAMGITSLLFGNWMLQIIMKFTVEIFGQIQAYGS